MTSVRRGDHRHHANCGSMENRSHDQVLFLSSVMLEARWAIWMLLVIFSADHGAFGQSRSPGIHLITLVGFADRCGRFCGASFNQPDSVCHPSGLLSLLCDPALDRGYFRFYGIDSARVLIFTNSIRLSASRRCMPILVPVDSSEVPE